MALTGVIFNIQRYSVQDGPGIRTTIFLKGCPMRCPWCSNPESWKGYPELGHVDTLCDGCGRCVTVCPKQAIAVVNGKVQVNRVLCNNCGECVPVCPLDALKIFGREMTVDEVMEEVRRDQLFYRNSEGGVTISGGEVLAQADFSAEVFRRCVDAGIHTAIESCGYAPRRQLDKILPYLDLALYDIKHMDSQVHKKFTGTPNERILENARHMAARGIPLIVRVPVIPGFNDDEANISATCQFAASMNGSVRQIDLLPYHRFGMGKWAMLDRTYPIPDIRPPEKERVEKLQAIIYEFGFECSVGG